ncbi:MAG: ribose 5-phosphate isomerase [Solirubrobacteraceae bacterium]|jgi:ribose 5-phosphate isomerase B|nr:ribose 5-phosphate isomerase [Solirubrobacteraceae bacterium]
MKFAVGFDHAGTPLRESVLDALREAGHDAADLGTCDDYPDIASRVCAAVLDGSAERGVIVCGSGAGVSVAACKIRGIRATIAHDTYTGAQCVSHDNCNVICLGARVVGSAYAADIVRAFAGAQFSGEERHVRRLAKVSAIEQRGAP